MPAREHTLRRDMRIGRCASTGVTPRPESRPTRGSPSARRPRRSAIPTVRSSSAWKASRCRTAWSAGRRRRPGAEVFPQAPACPARLRKARRGRMRALSGCGARSPDEAALRQPAREGALRRRDQRPVRCSSAWPAPGPTGAGRAATSTAKTMRAPSSTSIATCWPHRSCAPELAAVVQHRPALGLRHRRSGPGSLVTSIIATGSAHSKSSSAYEHPQPHACFIQSRRRRPRQRGRHHGPVGARGAPVQVRLGHRLELLLPAWRGREARRAAAAPPA